MVLAYKKISEEQDKMRNIVEKGEYAFSVKSVEEKPCKNGINKMLVVELYVANNLGRTLTIKDWITLDIPDMEWKFRHFAATCGLLNQYENDSLSAQDFLGKCGVAKITVSDYEKDGDLIKTNRIIDYIKPGQEKPKPKNDSTSFLDDDIPIM